jgi:hypothetical protein
MHTAASLNGCHAAIDTPYYLLIIGDYNRARKYEDDFGT